MNVGLVGIGLLGTAIAQRLLESGFAVRGWDVDPMRRQALESIGGRRAEDLADAFTPITILSLPTSDVVNDVLASVHLIPGQVIIDTTTGDPPSVEAIGHRLVSSGVSYIDASIAGSSEMLKRGEAIALVGGEREEVARATPVLDSLAKKWFHLGGMGSGSRMKLVVNCVLGLQRAVLAEGLGLAAAYGFDLSQTLAVLAAGPTAGMVLDQKGPKMVEREYQPQARLAQHLKDVRLILKEAQRLDARATLSMQHELLLEELVQRGLADLDNAAIFEAYHPGPENPSLSKDN